MGLPKRGPEYIPLGGGVKGVLYRPDSNPSPNVAVIIIHRTANYLQHAGCTQLSQRGLMVLCMNSRFDNNEALVELGADSSRRETWGGLPQKHAEDKQSHTCSVIAAGDQRRPTMQPLQKKALRIARDLTS